MRRVEGSTLVRHQREPKLLLSEVPRNRMGRLQTGNYVYLIPLITPYEIHSKISISTLRF